MDIIKKASIEMENEIEMQSSLNARSLGSKMAR
jgi:hypothetical protein